MEVGEDGGNIKYTELHRINFALSHAWGMHIKKVDNGRKEVNRLQSIISKKGTELK